MVTLYRFLTEAGALATLESQKLRVTQLSSLNDPFDCAPHIVPHGNWNRLASEWLTKDIMRRNAETFGVLCFSEVWDEPVLWSHYADCHRGVALVLEHPESELLFHIEYRPERNPILASEFMDKNGGSKADAAIIETLKVKSPTWSYEKEVRIIFRLDTCETSGGHYYTPIPKACLRGVVLGLRSECSREFVRRLVKRYDIPDFKVWQARKSDSRFALDRVEV